MYITRSMSTVYLKTQKIQTNKKLRKSFSVFLREKSCTAEHDIRVFSCDRIGESNQIFLPRISWRSSTRSFLVNLWESSTTVNSCLLEFSPGHHFVTVRTGQFSHFHDGDHKSYKERQRTITGYVWDLSGCKVIMWNLQFTFVYIL